MNRMINTIRTTAKKKIDILRKKYFVELNSSIDNTVFLAGTGRSGTTWISEVLNYNNQFRYIFEPFHNQYVAECGAYKYRQYLRPDNRDDKYIVPARMILSGKIKNEWTDKFNKKFWVQKRLIKDIRANLFLKWLKTLWPTLPVILLIRHPCAVAASKIKLNWDTHLEDYLRQGALVEDYLYPFEREIRAAATDFEKHIFLWCIENYIPLKQFNPDEIHVVYYESFVLNLEKELNNLADFLKMSLNIDEIQKEIHRPSALSRKNSAVIIGQDLLSDWKHYVSDKQEQRAVEILSLFGLDKIYDENVMPNTKILPWKSVT